VVAVGTAEEDPEVVVDELAAAICKDRGSIAQARSLLLTAVGRELSDAAPIWKYGGSRDCRCRVGELATESDFSDERGGVGKSVRGTGRKRVSFEFWDSAERQNRPVPWPAEAPALKTRLDLEFRRARGTLLSGRKPKTEILVYTPPNGNHIAEAKRLTPAGGSRIMGDSAASKRLRVSRLSRNRLRLDNEVISQKINFYVSWSPPELRGLEDPS
jgi:hypothetical protein